MTVGDMAELVRDHALYLVGVLGRRDQAGVDVHRLSPGHEGVDRFVVEQHDSDVRRRQAGRPDDVARHVREQRLGFGIAQDGRLRLLLRPCDLRQGKQQDDGEQRQRTARKTPQLLSNKGGHVRWSLSLSRLNRM